MGYLAARTQAGLGAGYQQDWVLVGLNAGAFAGKGLWYLKDKIKFIENGLKQKGPVKGPTIIVDLAMLAIGIMDLLNGVLAATEGDALAQAVADFDAALPYLELATPDSAKWSGDGAEAYKAQVEKLTELITEMQALDKKLQGYISDHAEKVNKVHQVIAACLLTLVIAQGIALVLWSIPLPVGPPLSTGFQAVTVAAVSVVTLAYEGIAIHSSFYKSALIDSMATEYSAIGTKAPIPGAFRTLPVPGSEETTVANFQDISNSMSGMSAMSGMPTFSSLLRRGGESLTPDEHEVVSALTGTDEMAAAGASETPAPEAPETTPPAITPPTLGQIGQASGQLAKMSGALSQPMNLLNQTMGQVQQIAQMGQQGQGAATPAAETAHAEAPTAETVGLEEDADGAGAGTQGAERAPIEVGAQPTPEQRTL
ncbi:MAG: hypothetical protein JOZ00_08545 [Mycobacterium sp.]|uniref:EspA/EspE family type VII secretion system effector n=1 Tax=Mycobacterium sp. TaxID=1785 RepID=UPI001EB95114|nr:EspA/EspE family type VII secretion system effector [Mycobacterium sp.]MBV8786723.1 hypothetical protein [Mycobacterium sp.]